MLVKIRLRTRPIFLWYAAKHKSPRYGKIRQQVVMNSSQPDIPVSARIPVIMVETVAPSSQRIAPHGAQSPTILMLRFGRNEMPYKPKPWMPVVNEINRRFLTVETGKYAMTLTPPRASGRVAGSRLAWPLVAKPDGKPTGELNAIGRNVVAVNKTKPSSCRWKNRQPPHGLNTATPNHRP
jgi:hypothetical protein